MHPVVSDIHKRDYNFNDLMTKTFSFYFKNFFELSLPYLVLIVITSIPAYFFFKGPFLELVSARALASSKDVFSLLRVFFKWTGSLSMIGIILFVLYGLYISRRVNTLIDANGETIGASISKSLNVYIAALITSVFMGLMIGISFIFLFIPALFLSVGLCLVYPAMALDGRLFIRAIGDSFNLLKGRYWRTFGFLLVLYLALSTAVSFIIMPSYIPFIIKFMVKGYNNGFGDISSTSGMLHFYKTLFFDPLFLLTMVIAMLVSCVMTGILYSALTIMYVNFRDTKPGQTGETPSGIKTVQ